MERNRRGAASVPPLSPLYSAHSPASPAPLVPSLARSPSRFAAPLACRPAVGGRPVVLWRWGALCRCWFCSRRVALVLVSRPPSLGAAAPFRGGSIGRRCGRFSAGVQSCRGRRWAAYLRRRGGCPRWVSGLGLGGVVSALGGCCRWWSAGGSGGAGLRSGAGAALLLMALLIPCGRVLVGARCAEPAADPARRRSPAVSPETVRRFCIRLFRLACHRRGGLLPIWAASQLSRLFPRSQNERAPPEGRAVFVACVPLGACLSLFVSLTAVNGV